MRQLKAAAKLCFDVDGLISAAFEELEPFPKRDELWRKREAFHNAAKRRAEQKERELSAIRERDRVVFFSANIAFPFTQIPFSFLPYHSIFHKILPLSMGD
nr:uncharacterized protein LOC122269675 [Parasteatoda tepidariorum]